MRARRPKPIQVRVTETRTAVIPLEVEDLIEIEVQDPSDLHEALRTKAQDIFDVLGGDLSDLEVDAEQMFVTDPYDVADLYEAALAYERGQR